jgi:hypothetical protein
MRDRSPFRRVRRDRTVHILLPPREGNVCMACERARREEERWLATGVVAEVTVAEGDEGVPVEGVAIPHNYGL